MKKLLLSLLLTLGLIIPAMAEEITFDFTTPQSFGVTPADNGGRVYPTEFSLGGVNVTLTEGTGIAQNAQISFFTSNTGAVDFRCGSSNHTGNFTVSCEKVISKIVLVGTVAFKDFDGYSAASKSWEGNANEVKFEADGQFKLTSMTVTIEEGSPVVPEKKLGEIVFNPADGSKVEKGALVTITCENAARIEYSFDGTTKNEYTEPVAINEDCTLTAWAYDEKDNKVSGEAHYTIAQASTSTVYELITKSEDIVDGAKYILATGISGDVVAMGEFNTGNFFNIVENIKADNSTIIDYEGNIKVITIHSVGDAYNISCEVNDVTKYMYCTSATKSNNKIYLTEDIEQANNFSIAFTENSDVIISYSFTADNTRYIRYNAQSPRITSYTNTKESNTNKPVYLYKLVEGPKTFASDMYVYGTFFGRDWHFAEEHEVNGVMQGVHEAQHTGHENGVYTFSGLQVHANQAGHFTFSTNAPAASPVANGGVSMLSDAEIDWTHLNKGTVYAPAENVTLYEGTPVELEEIPANESTERPNYVSFPKANTAKEYSLKLDLNTAKPTLTLEKAGEVTGVEEIGVEAAGEVEFYNLQGVRVANPENGIYLRRQGTTVSKVFIR